MPIPQLGGIAGTPLNDSFYLGQTIVNDYGRPYQEVSTLLAALAQEAKQEDLLSTSEGNISMLREGMAFDDRWRSVRNKPKSGDYPFRTIPNVVISSQRSILKKQLRTFCSRFF